MYMVEGYLGWASLSLVVYQQRVEVMLLEGPAEQPIFFQFGWVFSLAYGIVIAVHLFNFVMLLLLRFVRLSG